MFPTKYKYKLKIPHILRILIPVVLLLCLALFLILYYLPKPMAELTGIDKAGQITKLFLEKSGADGAVKALSGTQCAEAIALLKTLRVQRTGRNDTVAAEQEYFYSISVSQAETDEAERFSITSDGRVFFHDRVYLLQGYAAETIRALDTWYESAPHA